MNLIETVTWALVELQAPKPDIPAIQKALQLALDGAAKLDIEHKCLRDNLIRLAKAANMPELGGK